jgi:hypothetical protein
VEISSQFVRGKINFPHLIDSLLCSFAIAKATDAKRRNYFSASHNEITSPLFLGHQRETAHLEIGK